MTDASYNAELGRFIEENHTTLNKAARRAAFSCIGSYNIDETQHEMLMALTMYLYDNKETVLPKMNDGWLLQFALTKLNRHKYRFYSQIKSHDLQVGDWHDVAIREMSSGEEELTRLQYLHIDCDGDSDKSFETVRSMVAQEYSEAEVDKIARIMNAVEGCLDGHEKILFRLYFREQKSFRAIEKQIGLPRSAVHLMVKQIVEKIKKQVNG